MAEKGRRDFCIECRKVTEYILQKKNIVKEIRDKEYIFCITVAICSECGEEMSIPGLLDRNIHEIDEQYRAAEGLVSIDDIEKSNTKKHKSKFIKSLNVAIHAGEPFGASSCFFLAITSPTSLSYNRKFNIFIYNTMPLIIK